MNVGAAYQMYCTYSDYPWMFTQYQTNSRPYSNLSSSIFHMGIQIHMISLVQSIYDCPVFTHKVNGIGTDFLGGCGGGVCTPPEMICTPPKAFGTPANYIYFDLIVSYLIILTTKFVKLQILWSQISPCRPRKQILFKLFPWPFRALPPRPGQSKQQQPPRYLSTPPNENMKIRLWNGIPQ